LSHGELHFLYHNSTTQPIPPNTYQAIIRNVEGDTLTQLYPAFFRGNLASLSLGASSAHVVQTLISRCPDGAQLRLLADELVPAASSIANDARFYVFVRLAEAAVRYASVQKGICRAVVDIMTAGSPEGRAEVVPGLIYYETGVSAEKPEGKGVLFFFAVVLHYTFFIPTH
jgi:hypothetical protein